MGALPGDHVLLEMVTGVRGGCDPVGIEFVRAFPDGTSGESAFRAPQGKMLVVTDVDWYYRDGAPNTIQVLRLILENLAEPKQRRKVLDSPVNLNAVGAGGANVSLLSGIAVSTGARICVEVTPGPLGTPMRVSSIVLRGYLVTE